MALSEHPSANVSVFGDFNLHHIEWVKHPHGTDQPGTYSFNFCITADLTQIVDFATLIIDSGIHRPAFLDLFYTSDAELRSVEAPLGSSDHVVVSVSVYFVVSSENDTPYHCRAFDYSKTDWNGFCDHLRDVPWNDIYRYGGSKGAFEFSEWF